MFVCEKKNGEGLRALNCHPCITSAKINGLCERLKMNVMQQREKRDRDEKVQT